MEKLVECVPNFSEGRDGDKITAITNEIKSVDGVHLLDVDPGSDTNRTVVTFIGSPEAVEEAAFRAISKASEVIDMTKHQGAHARLGATDVCPFVPLSGVTMDDCVAIANRLGKRVGEELRIPTYLYENAATRPDRRNLADIRSGEYEDLAVKLLKPEWTPDYGPATFNERAGATVIGAREFLIAFNVNLNTRSRKLAHEIALNIREAGRAKRDHEGKIIRDENGSAVKVPGTLPSCKAVGWYIPEYQKAQVSMNLVNYKITPPHQAFEEVVKEADKLGLRVTGSELVGLIPVQAMLDAGRYFLKKQRVSAAVPEKELIRVAIESMGLNDISSFDPYQKIIEYSIRSKEKSLTDLSIKELADEISMDSPAPGGGSVASLLGSLGAALSAMVANLTFGKKGYEAYWDTIEKYAERCQTAKDFFLTALVDDTTAFNDLLVAYSLPQKTEEQKIEKKEAVQNALMRAIDVPFSVLVRCSKIISDIIFIAEHGNVNAISDVGVAAECLRSAAIGAGLNIRINLAEIKDEKVKRTKNSEYCLLLKKVNNGSDKILKIVEEKLHQKV